MGSCKFCHFSDGWHALIILPDPEKENSKNWFGITKKKER